MSAQLRTTALQQSLEESLDNLSSPHTSIDVQRDSLALLEGILADVLLSQSSNQARHSLNALLQLQDTFQYNIVTRLLWWLEYRCESLKRLSRRAKASSSSEDDFMFEMSVVVQALSLLQGLALLHSPSKDYLGRKASLRTFVDLLSLCRQTSSKPFNNTLEASPSGNHSLDDSSDFQLASAVLNVLLCVLVDAPDSLRAFEESKGVEHVVKLMKRSTIPKDTRIKCLEFLYFYLMDETEVQEGSDIPLPPSPTKHTQTSSFLFPEASSSLKPSPKFIKGHSTSAGSRSSTSSFSSLSPTPTLLGTPPGSPKKKDSTRLQPEGRLDMLKKDVDFVPQSPRKPKTAQIGLGFRRPGSQPPDSPRRPEAISNRIMQRKPSPLGRFPSEVTMMSEATTESTASIDWTTDSDRESTPSRRKEKRTRTMDEKKDLLGQLLGNVDALVDGVRNAGIWGLGE